MFKRPQYIALSVILLLALILVSLPARTTTRMKLALGGLFLPLFGLAGSAHQLSDQAGFSLRSKRDLAVELDQLRQELDQLRLRSVQNDQILEENARLREAAGWQRQAPWRVQLARVILRDPANWWRTVQIDRGSRDGVTTNLPVLTAEGLVGRVRQVSFNSSQVVLIGDPGCPVSALVEEAEKSGPGRKSGQPASHGVIVSGASSILDPTIVDLTFLDRQNTVKPGQRVITSGFGGVFPRGIPIGQITEARNAGHGLYLEARVKLAANLANVEEVFVMFP